MGFRLPGWQGGVWGGIPGVGVLVGNADAVKTASVFPAYLVASPGEKVGSIADEHPAIERIKIKNNNEQTILFIVVNLRELLIVPYDKRN